MENNSSVFKFLNDFRQLGCNNESHCAAAYRLYLHLCEERHLWDVQYHYSKNLGVIYVKARKQKCSPEDIYIPVLSFEDVPMGHIEKYQAELTTPDKDGNRSIILAFCDPSSSVLLYKMTNTIKPLANKPLSKNKLIKQRTLALTGNRKEET